MKNLHMSLLLLCFVNSIAQNDSIKHFIYNPDAGLQYKKNDFQCTTWAFAERLFSPNQLPAWRRVRQGMEFQLPLPIQNKRK